MPLTEYERLLKSGGYAPERKSRAPTADIVDVARGIERKRGPLAKLFAHLSRIGYITRGFAAGAYGLATGDFDLASRMYRAVGKNQLTLLLEAPTFGQVVLGRDLYIPGLSKLIARPEDEISTGTWWGDIITDPLSWATFLMPGAGIGIATLRTAGAKALPNLVARALSAGAKKGIKVEAEAFALKAVAEAAKVGKILKPEIVQAARTEEILGQIGKAVVKEGETLWGKVGSTSARFLEPGGIKIGIPFGPKLQIPGTAFTDPLKYLPPVAIWRMLKPLAPVERLLGRYIKYFNMHQISQKGFAEADATGNAFRTLGEATWRGTEKGKMGLRDRLLSLGKAAVGAGKARTADEVLHDVTRAVHEFPFSDSKAPGDVTINGIKGFEAKYGTGSGEAVRAFSTFYKKILADPLAREGFALKAEGTYRAPLRRSLRKDAPPNAKPLPEHLLESDMGNMPYFQPEAKDVAAAIYTRGRGLVTQMKWKRASMSAADFEGFLKGTKWLAETNADKIVEGYIGKVTIDLKNAAAVNHMFRNFGGMLAEKLGEAMVEGVDEAARKKAHDWFIPPRDLRTGETNIPATVLRLMERDPRMRAIGRYVTNPAAASEQMELFRDITAGAAKKMEKEILTEVPNVTAWLSEADPAAFRWLFREGGFRLPPIEGRFLRVIYDFNRIFKPLVTIANLQFAFMNSLGGLYQGLINPDVALKSLKAFGPRVGRFLAGKLDNEFIVDALGRRTRLGDARKTWEDMDLSHGVSTEWAKEAQIEKGGLARAVEKIPVVTPVAKGYIGVMRRLNQYVETRLRMNAALALLQGGMDTTTAGILAQKMMVDYTMVSGAHRTLRSIFPFIQFTIGQTPNTMSAMLRNPVLAGLTAKLYGDGSDDGLKPGWMRNLAAIRMPDSLAKIFGDPGGPRAGMQRYIRIFPALPVEDLNSLWTSESLASLSGWREMTSKLGLRAAPPLQWGMELATGVDIFTQRPLTSERGAPQTLRFLPKSVQGALGMQERMYEGRTQVETTPGKAFLLREQPLSRLVRTVDQLLDDDERRGRMDKILGAITGIRSYTVNERTEARRIVREHLLRALERGDVRATEQFFSSGVTDPALTRALKSVRQRA